MRIVINLEKLTKYYNDFKAVSNLSLEVKKGEIFGFIGPNGAGKTTTIKCILNFINKSEGHIYIDGIEIDKKNEHLKEYIGYVPSEVNLYKEFPTSIPEAFKKVNAIPPPMIM